jgi:hypothetical protein
MMQSADFWRLDQHAVVRVALEVPHPLDHAVVLPDRLLKLHAAPHLAIAVERAHEPQPSEAVVSLDHHLFPDVIWSNITWNH